MKRKSQRQVSPIKGRATQQTSHYMAFISLVRHFNDLDAMKQHQKYSHRRELDLIVSVSKALIL